MFASKIPWRHLQNMSSTRLQDLFSRRPQDAFSITIFRLPRFLQASSRRIQGVLQDVFKTSSRHLGRWKTDTLKTYWRSLQDMSCRRLEDVLKTNKCLLGQTNLLFYLQFYYQLNHRLLLLFFELLF